MTTEDTFTFQGTYGGEYVDPLFEHPEDAIIGRSLVSYDEIIEYMKKAFEADKNGEEFI
jgi:hypothetical protein